MPVSDPDDNGTVEIEADVSHTSITAVLVTDRPIDEAIIVSNRIPANVGAVTGRAGLTATLSVVGESPDGGPRLLLGVQGEAVLLADVVDLTPPEGIDSLVVRPSRRPADVVEVITADDTSTFHLAGRAAIADTDRRARVYRMDEIGLDPGARYRFWRAVDDDMDAAGLLAAGPDETNAEIVGEVTARLADRQSLILDGPDAIPVGVRVEFGNNVATRIDTDSVLGVVWTSFSNERGYSNPELAWDYFDGNGWRRLERNFVDGTENLARSGRISFTVPADLAATDIGGQDTLWIRARLIGGDYGRPKYVVTTEEVDTDKTEQTITVDTTDLKPPEIASIEAGFTLDEAVEPTAVVVDNNRTVVDQAQANAAANAQFMLFESAGAVAGEYGRSILLGLNAAPRVQAVPFLAEVADEEGRGDLIGQVLTAEGWRDITVDDDTVGLRRSGLFTLLFDADTANQETTFRLLGEDRFWIRLTVAESSGWSPTIHGLYLNAVPAEQGRTVSREIVGSGNGEPNARLALANPPVGPSSLELRVAERISDRERRELTVDGGPEPVVSTPGQDDSWVLWKRVDSFSGHDGDDRVYRLDSTTGVLTFGDGRRGRLLPAGPRPMFEPSPTGKEVVQKGTSRPGPTFSC